MKNTEYIIYNVSRYAKNGKRHYKLKDEKYLVYDFRFEIFVVFKCLLCYFYQYSVIISVRYRILALILTTHVVAAVIVVVVIVVILTLLLLLL